MDFTIKNRAFKATRLNVFEQGELSLKLAPLLPPMAGLVEKAMTQKDVLGARVFEFLAMAQPFAEALSHMKRDDFRAVLNITLGSVQVETAPSVWMPLWVASAGLTPLEDLNSFGKLIPVVVKVIQFNLADFMDGFLTRREEPQEAGSSGAPSQAAKTG